VHRISAHQSITDLHSKLMPQLRISTIRALGHTFTVGTFYPSMLWRNLNNLAARRCPLFGICSLFSCDITRPSWARCSPSLHNAPRSAKRTNCRFEIGSMPYQRRANYRQIVPRLCENTDAAKSYRKKFYNLAFHWRLNALSLQIVSALRIEFYRHR